MATTLGRMVIYVDGFLIINSNDTLIMWSCKMTWQTEIIIFTTAVPMITKLDQTVTYLDGLLPIKLHDPSITWSCEIT